MWRKANGNLGECCEIKKHLKHQDSLRLYSEASYKHYGIFVIINFRLVSHLENNAGVLSPKIIIIVLTFLLRILKDPKMCIMDDENDWLDQPLLMCGGFIIFLVPSSHVIRQLSEVTDWLGLGADECVRTLCFYVSLEVVIVIVLTKCIDYSQWQYSNKSADNHVGIYRLNKQIRLNKWMT